MDIPQGYKQTELGVIPDDWEVKKLGDLVVIRKQKIDPRKEGRQPFCVELEHIKQGGGQLIGYSETTSKSSIKTIFCKNDILFGKLRAYLRKYWLADRGGVASTEIWPLVARFDVVLPEYIYQLIQTDSFIESASISYGTHMPRADWNVIKTYSIPLPPLPEQKAIAQSLSDVDALITAIDKLITKKRNIKQGAMQELLTGKKRLPGFTGDRDVKKLGDIFDFKNGLNKEKKFFGIGTPIVNYMDVYKNRGLTAKDLKGRVTVTDKEIKTYEVRKGDVFFTRTSETVDEIGISSVIIEDLANTVFSGFVLRARPKNNWMSNSYKKYCFSSYSVRSEIISKSSYTTRALTNRKLLSNVNIFIPPTKEEQKAIAQILSDMDAEIESLEKTREKYKLIKRGIMQELLTGKKRLKHQLDP